MKKVLITGSSGLVGSEAVDFFSKKKFKIYAIDNDLRSFLFGKSSSTASIKKFQKKAFPDAVFLNLNITDYKKLENIFFKNKFDIIVHAAGQPSHDWSAKDPIFDFKINALGTLNLLELSRKYCPKSTFIYTSTNKVYGDTPNYIKGLKELKTRYEIVQNKKLFSINEKFAIDNSTHSPFGVSKTSGDLYVQEYGKYFGLKTVSFRCGCITGPNHKGAELHGFLSYLVKCIINNKHYKIYGYKGKQVRDNIHARDLVEMFWHFYKNPGYGEVYNAGGGRQNSISILEAINLTNKITGLKWKNFSIINENRVGDHIWYITDYGKFKKKYPKWKLRFSNTEIIKQIISNLQK
ncbi:NAD-dependent epimerase/dehydratase family protein [Candidatus Pelagibacter ubique]|nr:NAD-dependent epimerase/dehydratase family protein [Candidatus Pelagibacter ubique]